MQHDEQHETQRPTTSRWRHEARWSRGPVLLASAALACAVSVACDPFGTNFADEEPAEAYRARQLKKAAPAEELVVMTYNVKFGGGRIDFFFDCHGDRVLMDRDEVEDNLAGVAEAIAQVDPDVLLVQEADVNSKRSAFVDQVQWLLDHTDLNYGVYASHWRADYVPSSGLGAVDSGNAVLSKYPLKNGTRLAMDLREDQSGIERYFYIRRNILVVDVDVPVPVRVVATHTAAYSQDGTKENHIAQFKQELDAASEDHLVIGGGDLNTLPPGSKKKKHFDDSACTDEFEADDYSEEEDFLAALYRDYEPAISLADYQSQNARYFTHTTRSDGFWNRKLDYLFTNGQFVPGSGRVWQGDQGDEIPIMPLSDHAPVSVTLELHR